VFVLLGTSPASEFYLPTFGILCSIFIGGVSRKYFLITPLMKLVLTECSEMSTYKIVTPGNYPKVKNATFRTRRTFQIKNIRRLFIFLVFILHCLSLVSFFVQFIASLQLPFFSPIVLDLVFSFVSIKEH